MCGIVGVAAKRDITNLLLAGLQRLEYRGYDSAGIAVINAQNSIDCVRVVGKVNALKEQLKAHILAGNIGIAHTRWATHGKPSEQNAHPHISHDRIAVVHNGIIENYSNLRKMLENEGYIFQSQTDTEVISHLIHRELLATHNLLSAVRAAATQLMGSYSIAVLDVKEPTHLIAVRQASPLVIGLGEQENFIASDQLALLAETQKFIYLNEGDIADVSAEKIIIYDKSGAEVTRKIHESDLQDEVTHLGNYRHFMEKEIFHQPLAIEHTLEGYLAANHLVLENFGESALTLLPQVKHIQIVACGTSYHSAMVAKYWLEQYAKLPCSVEIASEFRYRATVTMPNSLFITISQSGETADTLAALQEIKSRGYLASFTLCNVPQSSLIRESDIALMTRAGPEIGVASTKAFTTQLTALLLLTGALAKTHNPEFNEVLFVNELRSLPKFIGEILTLNSQIAVLAEKLKNKQNVLFLGRGTLYPIALEGALKLKEISYIHAEAYPAGELKHGPLALVDADMAVIAIAPNNHLIEKLNANLQEVQTRGGELLIFADEQLPAFKDAATITMPHVPEILEPIIYTIPLQLLAYHVALLKGTDIDKPRNLAKSVTVE